MIGPDEPISTPTPGAGRTSAIDDGAARKRQWMLLAVLVAALVLVAVLTRKK